jgi:hypothetical protein
MATPGQSVTGRGTRPWMQQPRIKSGEWRSLTHS